MSINNINTNTNEPTANFFYPELWPTSHNVTYKGKVYKVEHQTITDLQTGEKEQLKDLRDFGLISLLKRVLLGMGE